MGGEALIDEYVAGNWPPEVGDDIYTEESE